MRDKLTNGASKASLENGKSMKASRIRGNFPPWTVTSLPSFLTIIIRIAHIIFPRENLKDFNRGNVRWNIVIKLRIEKHNDVLQFCILKDYVNLTSMEIIKYFDSLLRRSYWNLFDSPFLSLSRFSTLWIQRFHDRAKGFPFSSF